MVKNLSPRYTRVSRYDGWREAAFLHHPRLPSVSRSLWPPPGTETGFAADVVRPRAGGFSFVARCVELVGALPVRGRKPKRHSAFNGLGLGMDSLTLSCRRRVADPVGSAFEEGPPVPLHGETPVGPRD